MTRAERRAVALYRFFLRAFPREFRDEFSAEMEGTFLERVRTVSGRTEGLVARELAGLVRNGLRERRELRPGPGIRERLFHWNDLRHAGRLLLKTPVFTLLTVVVLAGGLGLSVFTFSFLHTAMVKPIPVDGGREIVRVSATVAGASRPLDAADLARIRPAVTTLSQLGAYTTRELLVGDKEGGRLIGATASEWNIFAVTRTAPMLGRGFRLDDQGPGAEPVVVLSAWAWRVVFGADSSLVDRTIILSGVPTRVIGVMPPGYGFPVAAEAWVPLPADALVAPEPGRYLVNLYARLAPGRSAAAARAELGVLVARAVRDRSGAAGPDHAAIGATVESFPMAQIGEEAPLIFAVLNLLAALILLLACINVFNLLLARINERSQEIAVRQALGASRGRLAVASMWETVILVLAGGVLATWGAKTGLELIDGWARARLEGNLAFWWVWRLDRAGIVAAGVFVTGVIATLGGVVAWHASRPGLAGVLRDGGARSGQRREGRLSRLLVVTQVAAVSVLLFFGTLAAVVAERVATVDVGFDAGRLLGASVSAEGDRYRDPARRAGLWRDLADRIGQRTDLDGAVLRAGLAGIGDSAATYHLGGDEAGTGRGRRAHLQAVSGQLALIGAELREGRAFDGRDDAGGVPVALVSAAVAAREWPGRSPLGRQLRLTGLGETAWRTVVGVVADVPLGNPFSRDRSPLGVYVPLGQRDLSLVTVVARHRGDERRGRAALHEAMAGLDPETVAGNVQAYAEILAKSGLLARSVTALFAGCFGFALILAVSGTYGLMSRSIGLRTREIGVRRALGADDGSILRMLLGQGGRQLGIGAAFALPVTALVGFGFSRFFPVGLAITVGAAVAVSAAITGVVLLATYLPTRRAIQIEPRDALWKE